MLVDVILDCGTIHSFKSHLLLFYFSNKQVLHAQFIKVQNLC